ncbi:sarcolemmal membrane-associated protein-like isoform X3 [Mytilus californianus]|uniref:sarcolemmal membrane-associated protein-like isoform X3 n=1 Tax=Mytilus californianus TaxID=6549 RepID=UPI002247EEF2|nr:sarcolemmal membrane-associated protein-like isoform X3 [Mytilus californianus]
MSAVAILSCQPNSHPFRERHISLHEPVKIGRSVARARPANNNGIFDCKVLSRNHAMLWYENGTFYLQDTKSSNGTFINNQRLCKGGEESSPREAYSGDHIQFGVDVMENNRRGEKITHGCIIATITLFHPDGREAKNIYTDGHFANTVTPGFTIQSQELYQLAQYLQEALHREKMLEQKFSTLQQLLNNTQESSEDGWQALIDEDRLLSRLEVLENQLHTYSKNHSEDALRQEVVTLQEEKLQYETTAKESLRRVLQEKLEAVRKLSDLERSLHNTEEECSHLKDMCEKSQEELQQLAEKYQDQLKEVSNIQGQLQDAENSHMEEREKFDKEKTDLMEKIEDLMKEESILSAKMEALQSDNDVAREEIASLKEKLESMKEPNNHEKDLDEKTDDDETEDKNTDEKKLFNSDTSDETSKIIPTSLKDLDPEESENKLKELHYEIEKYKAKMEDSESRLKESGDKVEQLQKDLEIAQLDTRQYVAKISSLEEKLKLSDLHMNQMMENTMSDLKMQLKESHKQADGSNTLIKTLQDRVVSLETELVNIKTTTDKADMTVVASSFDQTLSNHLDDSDLTDSGLEDDDNLKELLREARQLQKRAEGELTKCKDELDDTRARVQKSADEAILLKSKLTEVQKHADEKSDMVVDLQDQLKKAETTTKEVKQQILDLRDQLLEEQSHTKTNQEDLILTKKNLEQEKSKHKETRKELEEAKRTLSETQQSAKQNHNESEQLKNKVRHLQERLDLDRKERARESHHARLTHSDSHPGSHTSPNVKHRGNIIADFAALKDECASLRKRIQAIEAEMKMSRKENLQLSSEYNKLQESYKQLEALKQKLETKEAVWRSNMTDSQKETDLAKQEVRRSPRGRQPIMGGRLKTSGVTKPTLKSVSSDPKLSLKLCEAQEEIASLKSQCETYSVKNGELKSEIANMADEYKQLSDRSKVLSFCSSIPLLMLLFAVLVALYPTLAQITGTTP